MGRWVLPRGLALALLVFPLSAQAGGFALIIGISQYEDWKHIDNLRFADRDAQQIAADLRLYSNFPRDCIRDLINKKATRNGIDDAFNDLEKRCSGGPGPNVALIYFAGHAVRGGNGALKQFLIPYDGRNDEVNNLTIPGQGQATTNTTFIMQEYFANRLVHLSEPNISVIIDACHSEPPDFDGLLQFYSLNSSRSGTLRGGDRHVALLGATNEAGIATEFPALNHGALSYAVLKAIDAAREAKPKGQFFPLQMSDLFADVRAKFEATRINGKRLEEWHKPELVYYPKTGDGLVEFASLTGLAIPAAPAEIVSMRPPQPPPVSAHIPSTPPPTVARVTPPAPAPPPAPPVVPPQEPQFGYVQVVGAIPGNAYLEIDGQQVPWQKGAAIKLPVGSHILVIGEPTFSYREIETFEIAAGETKTWGPSFLGRLAVVSRDQANPTADGPPMSVILDGKPVGQGVSVDLGEIAAGTHQLTVRVFSTEVTRPVSIRPESPLLVQYLITRVPDPNAAKERRRFDIP